MFFLNVLTHTHTHTFKTVIGAELETSDENLHDKSSKDAGAAKRYYFENLKISLPQFKLSVFTSHKLPSDLKVDSRCFVLYTYKHPYIYMLLL